jgi:hypothetical protein
MDYIHTYIRTYRKESSSSSNNRNSDDQKNDNEVPSLSTIKEFFELIFSKSQLESECIIMSLIYVERLMKETRYVCIYIYILHVYLHLY